jgi:hypothetical protein
MKLTSLCRIGTITTAILLPLTLAAQTKLPKEPSNQTEAAKPAPVAAGPNHHLLQARALFDQGKMNESSTAIFKAVDSIHKQMITANSLPTEGVINASNRLESLADKVSKGQVKDGKILDRQFAKVSEEMAAYYAELARVAAGEQKPRLTRSALGRVGGYLENVAAWSGQKLTPADKGLIEAMQKVGATADQAGKTVSKDTNALVQKAPAVLEGLEKGLAPEVAKLKKPSFPGRKK